MANKKFKDGSYYWVRRQPTRHENGSSTHPHREPMMWDADRDAFAVSGVYCCLAPTALAEIGEIIVRRPMRITLKRWTAPELSANGRRVTPRMHYVHK
jgi:hypothetical protein